MALDAVIFDMDGTLLATTELHARAWTQAINEFGYNVGQDRVAIEIGKGGDKLAPAILGEEAALAHGQAMRKRHGELYRAMVEEEGVAVFPRVRELFDAVHERGLKIAVATASKQENLEKVIARSGLDLLELADEVVTDTDVERSKPEPDVVRAAVRKLDLSPAQCTMVGDTPYDVIAANATGVTCIGVLTGVHTRDTMYRKGARAVYQDTGNVLDHLDEALDQCSPGAVHLTQERMEYLVREALAEARKGMEEEEAPIGAVLAAGDGSILARGHNKNRERRTLLAHAEIVAFERLADLASAQGKGLILVSTLEPCIMCLGAAMETGIDTILYALPAPPDGGVTRCDPIQTPGSVMPRIIGGICRQESRALFEAWRRLHPEDDFVRVLLKEV